ncbi:uncharacterized protein Z518_03845 [Rhinocladiella mackenziei CBS 650.93]|uniref:Midasin n=1 Tax=Rhinocladiella mackenziei CBS 650.93 TaxID=1442369 RepID=A0A0D2FUV9_9EURO|nr:uncharacterized protein Z518_03845 [Rhinocladiella mackenziei CBS 650.93]KIX05872.1 hypothetical protein Z518_03845 [Rhinocladiella mackenziei CBS 650.93]
MDDIAVYCSWADAQLKQDFSFLSKLPTEVRALILQSTECRYFDTVAHAARSPRYADALFPLYKILYPELLARWTAHSSLLNYNEAIQTISCLARVLPFATYLRPHIRRLLGSDSLRTLLLDAGGATSQLDDEVLHALLLSLFRLLSFDRDILTGTVTPVFLSSFLYHPLLPMRYLAIQCLCMVMHFADALSEKMVGMYVGTEPIWAPWEDREIDYRFLKLWEEDRWNLLAHAIADVDKRWQASTLPSELRTLDSNNLSSETASLGGVLLPRSGDLKSQLSTFVLTPTAKRNLRQLGDCLLKEKPILLSGQGGSGKTSLIHEAAMLLNKQSSMITLYLNEQTDAKSLLGVYTSSADGESFAWQPGVLTKAIQEGRWVLIEDIDRSPAEVMGVLRPILENGELFLANRKERVKPKDGFRVFATVKTSGRSPSTKPSRCPWLLSPRLWNTVDVAAYQPAEIEMLLRARYSAAEAFIPAIWRIHQHVSDLYTDHPRFKSLQTRPPSLRDLLKWSRRIVRRIRDHNLFSTSGALPEQIKFDIFKDGVDCYVGYLDNNELHEFIAGSIAQDIGISPQQMRHCLDETPISISESSAFIRIGRSTLEKVPGRRHKPARTSLALTQYAQRTLDSISATASYSEPCLLVGETGVGKTTLVQHIANLVGQKLTVVNLSQQSEASDLLGGFKPVTTRSVVLPLLEKFNSLFEDTFSTKRNEKFQTAIAKAVAKQNWSRLAILWNEAIQMAAESLNVSSEPSNGVESAHVSKRRKITTPKYDTLRNRWSDFSETFKRVRSQIDRGDKNHTFTFVEGRLVQAVREGEWILLDELNLASPDTLDYVVSLLHNGDEEKPYLLLAESGNLESIVAHSNFRIFAAMNPATDAGKKDLPPGLRSRFTEIYVPPGDNNLEDLTKIIQSYLGSQLDNDKRAALDLAKAYLDLKKLNEEHQLTDGAGDIPHFSIRSLVRCLLYASRYSASHGLRRAIYEGFAMSFFTILSRASESLALPFLEKHLLSSIKNRKSFLNQEPKMPFDGGEYIAFRHHLVKKGPLSPDSQPHYIRTPSVERNLLNLARAASMRRFPILLQGPTSAGKTSMVEYLAALSGNKFVRINNHEHTDLQEYLGSYVSDSDGRLQYQEGVLLDALRKGHWIVLDELNLAPSDVLEALNRLLDDNRELLIPESQEIVRPHPNFMLFATQNPAGLYGGRKRLSRAFRNRFLELHFDDIPEDELEVILRERAQIAPSFCTKIVAVYKKLALQRQSSRLFEQHNSFATLRDLFRWAARPVDDRQQLAYHGFMLLAERVRDPAERIVVKKTIEETLKVDINEELLYGLSAVPDSVQQPGLIVWTPAMRRLFVLVSEALKNNEPVLLVGETGCGKTQICQVVADAFGRPLDIYNAHTNTETGDLIGSQRPVRNRSDLASQIGEIWRAMLGSNSNTALSNNLDVDKIIEEFGTLDQSMYDPEIVEKMRSNIGAYKALFAWNDGSLVRAMKKGEFFLLDEISLADDSVLERLNSVLEPSRTILLAEKGSLNNLVVANPGFQFLATMNPGGDYGKRELSAALRNRLTEIWVPPLSQEADVVPIVQNKLHPTKRHLAGIMLGFATWFRSNFRDTNSTTIPLRDLLAWADFVNRAQNLSEQVAFVQGAFMVYVDSIGANPAGMASTGATDLNGSRHRCLDHLQTLVSIDVFQTYQETPQLSVSDDLLFVGPFSLNRSSHPVQGSPDLVFDAPTTLQNTMRIVRALQMTRPILLEGSPGVGKTAIVTALAQALGRPFTRINLSDQTDLMDLFGADAPSENEQMGKFSWQNGPLLDAMQSGGWVLLDEMNLASQSVLEGLNSCLDHRREVYIAELDKSFTCHPDFTLFAAQNPHHQGGGRKGLPTSFVNRFTVVYADAFQQEDLMCICRAKFPNMPDDQFRGVIKTVAKIGCVVAQAALFTQGGPWELNIRDVNRWLALCGDQPTLHPFYHFNTIVKGRFRTSAQRDFVSEVCKDISSCSPAESFYNRITPTSLQIGSAFLSRDTMFQHTKVPHSTIPVTQLPVAKSIITAINKNWPVILAGPSGSGKSTLIRSIAAMSGVDLVEFSMNSDVDTMDLVGGFEQYDVRRDMLIFHDKVKEALRQRIAASIGDQDIGEMHTKSLRLWQILETGDIDLSKLRATLPTVLSIVPELKGSVEALSSLLHSSENLKSRFVWNDGILVDAVERGSWLVLDNANLCNPSVLDRLNSLLEPCGLLAISEQHSGSSGTRIVKPHPNFRIFLTVDPCYGELSRAMRNRSLEIFMPKANPDHLETVAIQYPCDSAVSRLRPLSEAASKRPTKNTIDAFVDHLSIRDMTMISPGKDFVPRCGGGEQLALELSKWNSPDTSRVYQMFSIPEALDDASLPQLVTLNEPLTLLGGLPNFDSAHSSSAELVTLTWYTNRRLRDIKAKLRDATIQAITVPARDRTILEKSAIIANGTENPEAIPEIFLFANSLIQEISVSLLGQPQGIISPQLLEAADRTLILTQDLVRLGDAKKLDVACFQAYLQIGATLARFMGETVRGLASTLQALLDRLSAHKSRLITGLGLQLMWQTFRPKTAGTASQLETQLALEGLISRFDYVCRSLPQPRTSLSALRSKLRLTYRSIVESEQPETSLSALREAVAELEHQSAKGFFLEGKFENVMNYIYQIVRLKARRDDQAELETLAMFIPESERNMLIIEDDTSVAASLSQLASMNLCLLTDQDSTGLDLFKQLSSVQEQYIGILDHAKEELLELAKVTTSHTTAFETDTITLILIDALRTVLSGIVSSHYEYLTKEARLCFSSQKSLDLNQLARLPANKVVLGGRDQDFFREMYLSRIYPTLVLLQKETQFGLPELQTCLISLSLAGLFLLVPNQIFDPAILPNLVIQQHERRITELESIIDGQKRLHEQVMGQDTSFVIRVLQKELLELGNAPPPPTVFRPTKSELPKLQEIFKSIVSLITDERTFQPLNKRTSQQGKSNLAAIVRRLESSNRAYDDFVKPISWFLKCLSFGLQLQETLSTQNGRDNATLSYIPILAVGKEGLQGWSVPVKATSVLRFQWLEYLGLKRTIGWKQDSTSIRDLIRLLDEFYDEWKARLTKDQAEAAIQSRYYTYRGNDENQEEMAIREMGEMFPKFESEDPEFGRFEATYDARATAVKLCQLHQKLYSTQDPQEALREFALRALDTISKLKNDESATPNANLTEMLPGILLQMETKMAELNGTLQRQDFNIYTDFDVSESQKLYNVVSQLQSRFRAIQERWPEHAVPAEVLSFSREILHLSIGDPVAKLLMKTEKLYEIVSRWQSVASREWSVSPLLENLSTLIISWRRLELLSWSGLLDQEKRKHEEDASAWYFVAYEAVIYNSTRIPRNGESVQSYCQDLARTLEEFFKTTTWGQYSSRIRLLETLNKTLADLASYQDYLLPLCACVTNVIVHHRRYEAHIETSHQNGRSELEKALKEQIKLASWKDTNVTALRDSARRSHHKLFKIVRKYRGLLNQVVPPLKSSGDSVWYTATDKAGVPLQQPQDKGEDMATAVKHCERVIGDWKTRPERLTNPMMSVRSMSRLYLSKGTELQVHLELAAFRDDLVQVIKELRTQTPQTLTDENSSLVRHLQERKRRLLADTLKEVAQMGIRRNLPSSALEKQSSPAVILASSPDVLMNDSSPTLSCADESFHGVLDAMSQVRASRTDHSEDVTEGEVSRSVGLLEGLLFVTIGQRQEIASSAECLHDLKSQLSLLRSVNTYASNELLYSTGLEEFDPSSAEHLGWLAEILVLACHILNFQAQHAHLNVKGLVDSMRSYSSRLKEFRMTMENLPGLPSGLISQTSKILQDRAEETLSQLGSLLSEWQIKEPLVRFILQQIIPWTAELPKTQSSAQNGTGHVTVQSFDHDVRTLVDQILVALQRLSSVQDGMPNSIEDQGWLSTWDRMVVEAIRSMQASTISDNLKSLLITLRHVVPEDRATAKSLLLVASPIIEQYYYIYQHLHKQHTESHLEVCRLTLQLANSFITLSSQGFCRPSDPTDDEEPSGKLESGTGLGDGEGVEDISKDVGDDEDLSDLAQSGQKEENNGESENADDAVDVGSDDLQEAMGDSEEHPSDQGDDRDFSGDEDENEMDEETGSVDDLDPSAVDEKLWDDMKSDLENDKEMQNDEKKGQKSHDQTAADGEKTEKEDMEGSDVDEDADEDDDQDEGAERPEVENMDPHLDNEEALDLPEELQLAGEDEMKDDEISDHGMDELSDMDNPAEEEVESGEMGETEREDQSLGEGAADEEIGEKEYELENDFGQDDEIMEGQPEEPEDDKQDGHDTREDNVAQDWGENAGGESGAANELHDTIDPEQNIQGMNQIEKEASLQQSRPGDAPENQEQGQSGTEATEPGTGRTDTNEYEQNEALKKLAHVLDQWHERREILPMPEEQHQKDQNQDVDMAGADFEHVNDENAGDAQALSAAAADQAQNLDQSKAIEDDDLSINEDTYLPSAMESELPDSITERLNRLQAQPKGTQSGEASFVPGHQWRDNKREHCTEEPGVNSDDLSPDIERLDLAHNTDLPSPPTSAVDAAQLWNYCSTTTHQFSVVLAEQLRLILSPTTATKLRGDYRTGKRLNIKRIIPYIASNYKRDKIWMRRSVPSKRNYQIMIAVDDSKSMSESSADILAFETLAMLTKALSILEVGEICIVGFGDQEHIRVAHPFGTPFSPAESGIGVFRAFSFAQRGTNVKNLVRESLQLFRDARIKASSGTEDLWQLQLIVSDGHCSDHGAIARLVRQAHAEKIIMVFVIVDASAGSESILDLKQAVFEPDLDFADGEGPAKMTVRTKRYLDDFPFPYYLVVRDVRDLPRVLASALKGWFASVVDVQG